MTTTSSRSTLPYRSVSFPLSSGITDSTFGTSAITASRSSKVKRAACLLPSRQTDSRFAPAEVISSTTRSFAPSPTASIVMTDATPMTTPSSVRNVRNGLVLSDRMAIRTASQVSAREDAVCAPSSGVSRLGCACCAARAMLRVGVSLTIMPSSNSIRRSACSATTASCVITITVWPCRESSSNSAISSLPLPESSAPVGSSARITRPPFINARATDTRCCSPPESWLGK